MKGSLLFSSLEGEMSPRATEGVDEGSALRRRTSSTTATTPPDRFANRLLTPSRGRER